MKELERLIRELRRQMLPYHHERDLETGRVRWEVGDDEYLTSWISQHLAMCMERNRCSKRGRCAFYRYGDLARRNYEVCREFLLRMETGSIRCRPAEEDDAEG